MSVMRTGIVLIALLVLGPTFPVWAAISFSAVTNSVATDATVLTQTTSTAIASCTQCVLLACIVNEGNIGVEQTGITFNTTENFVKVGAANRSNAGVENVASLWYLVNPTVTTANSVVTFGATSANDRGLASSFLLYQGVDQSTPSEASNTATNTGTTATVSVTTISANAWVADCAIGDHGSGLTVDAAQTMRVDRIYNSVAGGQGASDITVVSPGVQAMTWTQTTEDWATIAMSLKPYVAASGCSGSLVMMGVGGC